jgi:hypothetical protein
MKPVSACSGSTERREASKRRSGVRSAYMTSLQSNQAVPARKDTMPTLGGSIKKSAREQEPLVAGMLARGLRA